RGDRMRKFCCNANVRFGRFVSAGNIPRGPNATRGAVCQRKPAQSLDKATSRRCRLRRVLTKGHLAYLTLTVSSMLPPRFPRQELQRLMNFGALSRGFGTCCLRFKTGVATTPARLASGWLARLYREGVEPSGSLQKVSDRSLILLFWIYPGAR